MFGYFVDFFFVLSGFVLMHTYGAKVTNFTAYRDFMRRRLARVYPLHAAVTLVFGAVAIYLAVAGVRMRDASTMDPALIAPHLALIHAWGFGWQPGLNFPSWSISAELFVYLLFPLFAILLTRAGVAATFAAALLFAIVMELVRSSLGMRSFTDATWDFGMLRAVPTFMAGMALQRLVMSLPRLALPWWIAHAFMALVIALLFMQANIYLVLVSFVAAVGVLAITERGGRRTFLQHRYCVMLGDASYAVYLLHTMFQVATLMLARKLGFTQWPELIALALAGTVIIVTVSIFCYRWFEAPARRLLSRPFIRGNKLTGVAPTVRANP